jgi:hypothetical protein
MDVVEVFVVKHRLRDVEQALEALVRTRLAGRPNPMKIGIALNHVARFF